MSDFRTTFITEVEYAFNNSVKGEFLLTGDNEPIGWKEDLPNIRWSKDYQGAITKYATNLEFINEAADYIIDTYNTQGKEADIFLSKKKIHPYKLEIVTRYDNLKLDGYSMKIEYKDGFKKVKINAVEGNLNTQLKSAQNEQIEVESTETLDGQTLPALKKEMVKIDGKQLLFVSDLQVDQENQQLNDDLTNTVGLKALAIPLQVISSPDFRVQYVTDYILPTNTTNFINGNTGNMFYLKNDRLKTIVVDFDFNIDYTTDAPGVGAALGLVRYTGDTFNFVSVENLAINGSQNGNLTYQSTQSIDLQADESLAICVYAFDGSVFQDLALNLTFNGENKILITEQSVFPETTHDVVLPFEFLNRMLQIVLNRTDDVLISSVLNRIDRGALVDGECAYIGLTSMWWMRQFVEKKLTTSWKDVFDSLRIVSSGVMDEPLDLGIQTVMGKKMVVVEKRSYFNQDVVAIRFPNKILNVKRKTNTDYIHSSIDIGYESGGTGYEEAGGLDEPMGKYTYNTPITKVEKKMTIVSKWSADPTKFELTRRLSKERYPDRDSRFDEENAFIDMKKQGGIFVVRIWSDDYGVLPSNMFSPETYFNYRFLPSNLIRGFGRDIMTSLYPYTTQSLKFTSGIGLTLNEDDTSPTIDGNTVNANIPISELTPPRHIEEEIEFEHYTDFNLIEAIEGAILIKGLEVPSIYCLAEVINEEGEKEFIRLRDIKPSGKGKYKGMIVRL